MICWQNLCKPDGHQLKVLNVETEWPKYHPLRHVPAFDIPGTTFFPVNFIHSSLNTKAYVNKELEVK